MSEQPNVWKNAGLAGIAFGLLYGPIMSWLFGWLPPSNPAELAASAMLSLFAGALFALGIGLVMSWQPLIDSAKIELADGETVVHEGLANHFRGLEARGGRLVLTDRRLVFAPHAFNLQKGGLTLALSEIKAAEPARTYGLVPNGLLVTLADGHRERFVVNDRAIWAARLTSSGAQEGH